MRKLFPEYLARLWLEAIGFKLLRISLIPACLKLSTTKALNRRLSYEELQELNKLYRKADNPTASQVAAHQQKWAGRVSSLTQTFNSRKILEVGCGNGLTSFHLLSSGLEVCAVDIVDIRTDEVKQSPVRFDIGNVCVHLPYQDNAFDFIFSINSFEHFEQPANAFAEMIRVVRPSGILFLAFSPLYYSAWGLHAGRRLGMPYPQLLFSPSTIHHFVDLNHEATAQTNDELSDRNSIGPYVNGYSLPQYRQVLAAHLEVMKKLAYVEDITGDGMKIIFRYPGILKSQVPSCENLFVSGIKFLARKTGAELAFQC